MTVTVYQERPVIVRMAENTAEAERQADRAQTIADAFEEALGTVAGTTEVAINKPSTGTSNPTVGAARLYQAVILPKDWLVPEDLISELRWTARLGPGSAGVTAVLEFFDRPDTIETASNVRVGDHAEDVLNSSFEFPIAAVGLTADNVIRSTVWTPTSFVHRKAGHYLMVRWSVEDISGNRVATGQGVYTDAALNLGPGALKFSTATASATSNDTGFAIAIDKYISPTAASEAFQIHTERLTANDVGIAEAKESALAARSQALAVGDALIEVEKVIAEAPQTGFWTAASLNSDEWSLAIPIGDQDGAIAPGREISGIDTVIALQAGAVLTRQAYIRRTGVNWFTNAVQPLLDTPLGDPVVQTITELGLVVDESQRIPFDVEYTAKSGDVLFVHFKSRTGADAPLPMGIAYASNPEAMANPYPGSRMNNTGFPGVWNDNIGTARVHYEVIGTGYELPDTDSGGGETPSETLRSDTAPLLVDRRVQVGDGQSNDIGADSTPIPASLTTFGGEMFNGGERAHEAGAPAVAHATIDPLVPSLSGTYGDAGFTGFDLYMGALYATLGLDTTERGFTNLFTSVGRGGVNMGGISAGGAYWQRKLDVAASAVLRSIEEGKIAAISSIGLTHGENPINTNTGDLLKDQILDYVQDVDILRTYTKQDSTIPVIGSQVASHNWYGEKIPTEANAQLAAHLEDRGFYLATPTYMLDYAPNGAGHGAPGLHMTAQAQRIKQAYFALVEWHLRQLNQKWECLHWVQKAGLGRIARFEFNAPLVWDTVAVDNPGDYGWSVVKEDGTEIALDGVEIEREVELRIECAVDPGSNFRVQYGAITQAMITAGKAEITETVSGAGRTDGLWKGGRGNLRDNFGAGFPNYVDAAAGIDWPMHRWKPMEIITFA